MKLSISVLLTVASTLLIQLPGFAAEAADEQAQADAGTVEAVAEQAAASATYADFVHRSLTAPEVRDEAMSYLDSLDLATARMATLKSEKGAFVIETFGGELRAQYESQPRPLAKLFSRVIYLDRPMKTVAADLADALKSKLFGANSGYSSGYFSGHSSGLSALFPRANADEDYNRAVAALAAGLRAAQARSTAAAPAAAASALEEVQANACEVGYQFDCVDKKTDGRDYRINVTMPGNGFFSRYRVENFKKDGAGSAPATVSTSSYTLKKYWSEWDTSPCIYSVVDSQVTKSSPPSCGQGALQTLRMQNKRATKADAVIPKIAVAALIRCCSEDSQCHRKVKECVNRGAKSDRLTTPARTRQAPNVR